MHRMKKIQNNEIFREKKKIQNNISLALLLFINRDEMSANVEIQTHIQMKLSVKTKKNPPNRHYPADTQHKGLCGYKTALM